MAAGWVIPEWMIKCSLLPWVALAAMLVAVSGFAFFARHSLPPFAPRSALPQDERSSIRLVREPCKLCDGLYLLGHLSPAAVYVVETSEGLLMIDSGLDDTLGRPDLQAISMPGADATAVSYHFSIGDDEVLVTGVLPIERTLADLRKMSSDGVLQTWDMAALRASLAAIEFFQPKLWLSAHPLHGRNANLYGSEWLDAVARTRKLLRQLQKTGGMLPAASPDAMR
jgi:hypothetical protein